LRSTYFSFGPITGSRGILAWVLLLSLAASACTNQPPVLDPIPNQAVEMGGSVDLQATATDPEGEPLTFFAERLPEGATFDSVSGRLSWAPTVTYPWDYFITVGVQDTEYPPLVDIQNVMLSVIEPGSRDGFGTIHVTIRDADTGKPVAARVKLRGSDWASYGSRDDILHNTFFFTEGTFTADLPPGPAEIMVYKGTEYKTATEVVDVPSGESVQREVEMERWIHMWDTGWYSGDVHIHQNYGLDFVVGTAPVDRLRNSPEDVKRMVLAEDLNVANLLVSNSLGDGLFDLEYFEGKPNALSDATHILSFNQEFRSPLYGHMTLLNLKSLVLPSNTGYGQASNPYDYPSNAQIADQVHEQDGMVIYAHPAYFEDSFASMAAPAARELGMDIALEKVDALEVLNYPSSDQLSMELWYRVLNCGYRIPGVAGTDVFLNWVKVPFAHGAPGGNRVYVKTDGVLNYSRWIEGLEAGRSFFTNGPVISLSVNGSGVGSELSLSGPSPVTVSVEAELRHYLPLERLEIVWNGEVVFTGEAGEDSDTIRISTTLDLDSSGWIAARALGDQYQPDISARPWAHTNPVFIVLDSQPVDSSADRLFFVQQIDRLLQMVEIRDRFANQQDKDRFLSLMQSAREIHQAAAAGASR